MALPNLLFQVVKGDERHVDFDGAEAFFESTMLAYVERTWESRLGPLVADLPTFHLVVEELRPQIEALVR